jgi:Tfp pilus assembly protein PilF
MLSEARKKDPRASVLSLQLPGSSSSEAKAPSITDKTMEQMIDNLADQHLEEGDKQQALEIAKLGALAYPTSPIAYGVLCEAYADLNQKDLARESGKKALEVLSADTVYPEQVHVAVKQDVEEILKKLDAAK